MPELLLKLLLDFRGFFIEETNTPSPLIALQLSQLVNEVEKKRFFCNVSELFNFSVVMRSETKFVAPVEFFNPV